MKINDKYYDVCLENGDFGFELTYKNGRLGKINNIYPDKMNEIGNSKCCDDPHIFVKCGNCGTYMDYIHSISNSYSGKWVCFDCGKYVKQSTVNRHFSNHPIHNDYSEYYDDLKMINNEPDCCKACGGPYPNCMSSCKIFDD